MAGSAAPEQTGAEADLVLGVGSSSESPTTKALTVGVSEVIPEEENVTSSPEPEPKALRVKGLPAGGNGATGKRNLHLGLLVSCCMWRWVHTAFVLSVVLCLIGWRILSNMPVVI